MKLFKVILMVSFTINISAQISVNKFYDNFDNNNNNWVTYYGDSGSSKVIDGNYALKSNTSIFLKRKYNYDIKNKERYSIESNFRLKFSSDYDGAYISFFNDEKYDDNGFYDVLNSFNIGIEKYKGTYYFVARRYDRAGNSTFIKLNNFNINKKHNIKIEIINTKESVLDNNALAVFLDNKNIFSLGAPLFSFHNVGFNLIGNTEMIVDDFKLNWSENKQNSYRYDVIDRVQVKKGEALTIFNGYKYANLLTEYIPLALLYDDYFQNSFIKIKKRLIEDSNCDNFSLKDDPNFEEQKAFSFTYNTAVVTFNGISSEANHFTAVSVSFSKKGDSSKFFKLFVRAKDYVIDEDDLNRASLSIRPMSAIINNTMSNSVLIFY